MVTEGGRRREETEGGRRSGKVRMKERGRGGREEGSKVEGRRRRCRARKKNGG